MSAVNQRRLLFAYAGLLIVSVLIVYWPVVGFEFVEFDDDVYITDNPAVRAGLTGRGAVWAMTSGHAANWHPLTWLSHMLDVSLFGLAAGGHHAVNLLFHIANTLLVFGFFVRTTGHRVSSAAVAMLFAIHPLHVESVAWVSERKDVLSAFFGLACLHFYAEWTTKQRRRDMALALVCFAAGLLAKPMLVTLPFVLLLLDAWPLGRLDSASFAQWRDRVREKAAFFALSLLSSMATIVAQRSWGAMQIGEEIAMPHRLANAVVSYVRYLGKTFWPSELSILYPHPYAPGGLPYSVIEIAGAVVLLFVITACVLRFRRHPYLAVGWFWFVGMLVPVLGIVQVGGQAMADRYTYLPHVGLFAALVFAARAAAEMGAAVRIALLTVLAASALGFASVAHQQTAVWRDSLALFEHASTVTPGNPIIENHYAAALQRLGRNEEAIRHYRRAIQFDEDNARSHSNLGRALQQTGREREAIHHFERALEIEPRYVHALTNLGIARAFEGKLAESERLLRRAMEIDPRNVGPVANLGTILMRRGDFAGAVEAFEATLRLNPEHPTARRDLEQAMQRLESAR